MFLIGTIGIYYVTWYFSIRYQVTTVRSVLMVGTAMLQMLLLKTANPVHAQGDHMPETSFPRPVLCRVTGYQPVTTVHRDTRDGTVSRAWKGTLDDQGLV